MRKLSRAWMILIVSVFVLVTGCDYLDDFKQKVIEETQKTAHYTIDLDEDTAYTLEQLIDEGRVDRVVFDGKLYEFEGSAEPESKGENLGFIGKTYYVDQEGKRWTEEELKKPYINKDPKDIREKRPLIYGLVYRYKGEPKGSTSRIVIEFNRKLVKAKLIRGE
ncbi:SpaI protein [Paenibacillus sp. CAA11]|uniref:NisI/SpaI family lantibiotic immunity lipoprotein n=1 Tax=Paenibacillus sp. CAA11 TaxID=1532905 RepID=UPI000D3B795E|nr:NisI/SpaI family lantibiotic immunity lipoprotein [Paenibacillus sp. CAA11]AWB44647.1 SpaI protein [Paenibacillus sp. CAA11]